MYVGTCHSNSLRIVLVFKTPTILVHNGLKLMPSKALTIVSGFKPQPFLYRMDLNNDKSQKG